MKQFRTISVMLVLLVLLAMFSGCGKPETAGTEAAATTTTPVTASLPILTTEAPTTVPVTTEPPTTEVPTTAAPETTTEPPLSEEELARLDFYDEFWELDPEQTDKWLEENDALEDGYPGVYVNEAGIYDKGLDLYTIQGDQVVALDAENGILIIRTQINHSNTVMAIAKRPGRLHLCEAAHIGSYGERIASIAQRNNAVLAMTGSGFIDRNGNGNGGALAGYCMCSGRSYGSPMGWNYSRFELLENNWAIVSHADGPAARATTDCMEFQPAILIDGVKQSGGLWDDIDPRAAIGQNSHKDFLMVVVEGRYRDSPGCPVSKIADLMLKYDGINAMNVDGGTTAIMWYRGEILNRCSNPRTPDGRYLPNAWVYKAKKN